MMKSNKTKGLVIFVALCFFFKYSFAQQNQPAPTYPNVVGFFAVLVPVGTLDNKGYTANFSKRSVIGIPFGLNLLKSEHIGYSLEMVPFISAQNGSSRMEYMVFHPGVMFRYSHDFTFIPRLAFQTDGRYGFTPVFSKVIIRQKNYYIYLSLSEAARFGNNLPSSYSTGLQLGIGF